MAAGKANDPATGTDRKASMPLSMQLALGTLKLEETDTAVTPEQAADLLPLWKAANSLTGADNITNEEMNGLFKQIQETMTANQMKAIQSMDLSGQSMTDLAKKYGIQMPGNGFGNLSPEQQATMEASRGSGQQASGGFQPPAEPGGGGPPPGGGPDGGGGAFPGGGSQSSSRSGSQSTQLGGQGRSENAIYKAVIDLLEKKLQ
jgi:hypothetical protein